MRTELATEADRSVTVTPHPAGQLSALILGFFAAAWFGWAHGGTPDSWAIPLDIASLGCVLVAVFAAVRVWRGRRHGGARNDPGSIAATGSWSGSPTPCSPSAPRCWA